MTATPGMTIQTNDDSRRGVIDRGLGGGDFLVKMRDGSRVAINERNFTVVSGGSPSDRAVAVASGDVPDVITKGDPSGVAIGAGGEEVSSAESVPGGGLTQLDVTAGLEEGSSSTVEPEPGSAAPVEG